MGWWERRCREDRRYCSLLTREMNMVQRKDGLFWALCLRMMIRSCLWPATHFFPPLVLYRLNIQVYLPYALRIVTAADNSTFPDVFPAYGDVVVTVGSGVLMWVAEGVQDFVLDDAPPQTPSPQPHRYLQTGNAKRSQWHGTVVRRSLQAMETWRDAWEAIRMRELLEGYTDSTHHTIQRERKSHSK